MQRDLVYLLDIQGASLKILAFLKGIDEDRFLREALVQAAVSYELAIIGEAAGKLSVTFREAHPGIPWQRIKGLRNHLIHAYGSVDPQEVWRITQQDLPGLLSYVASLIPPDSE